jgi:hypothetical protein
MEEIKAAGLWRVFDDLEEFWRAVSKWITHPACHLAKPSL